MNLEPAWHRVCKAWLDNAPSDDSLGPSMNLFFEITEQAVAIIPEELQL